MNRFASIATSSPDAPNQFKRPTPGRPLPSSNYAVNLNSSTNGVAATTNDDSRVDTAAHRALLRNELLNDTISDIRVSFYQSTNDRNL